MRVVGSDEIGQRPIGEWSFHFQTLKRKPRWESAPRRSVSAVNTVCVTARRSVKSSRRSKCPNTPSTTASSAAKTRSSENARASGSASRATRSLPVVLTC
ncbi:hypothetical protein Ae201684_001204 [Aphanomyces euteiches]|uniref:Uncharacterized protein n=1 Tax=Aphanomyces euteiches TaxID=100861 RepID=A0A6G0XWA8_9STRA|nr:hypothetical protein Ae201684_001204 [Aphanomyces euteiches]